MKSFKGNNEQLRVCQICYKITTEPRYSEGTGKEILPTGVFLMVLSYLQPSEIILLCKVNQSWNYTSNHPVLWKWLLKMIFPNLLEKSSESFSVQLQNFIDSRRESLMASPAKDEGQCYKKQPPTLPSNEHCTLAQRGSNGIAILKLPQYAAVGSVVRRGESENLLSFSISVSDIRNWKYFVFEKILEVAHLDLEYPINSSLYSRIQIITKVLSSFESRLMRGIWIPSAT